MAGKKLEKKVLLFDRSDGYPDEAKSRGIIKIEKYDATIGNSFVGQLRGRYGLQMNVVFNEGLFTYHLWGTYGSGHCDECMREFGVMRAEDLKGLKSSVYVSFDPLVMVGLAARK